MLRLKHYFQLETLFVSLKKVFACPIYGHFCQIRRYKLKICHLKKFTRLIFRFYVFIPNLLLFRICVCSSMCTLCDLGRLEIENKVFYFLCMLFALRFMRAQQIKNKEKTCI
jgi:hypothetical protein